MTGINLVGSHAMSVTQLAQMHQLQSSKPPAVPAASDPDHDGDNDHGVVEAGKVDIRV